jgi:hypothetical protein
MSAMERLDVNGSEQTGIETRVRDLETAQAAQAATTAGAEATQSAAMAGMTATHTAMQVGNMATMIAGSAGFIIGIFLGLAIARARG